MDAEEGAIGEQRKYVERVGFRLLVFEGFRCGCLLRISDAAGNYGYRDN